VLKSPPTILDAHHATKGKGNDGRSKRDAIYEENPSNAIRGTTALVDAHRWAAQLVKRRKRANAPKLANDCERPRASVRVRCPAALGALCSSEHGTTSVRDRGPTQDLAHPLGGASPACLSRRRAPLSLRRPPGRARLYHREEGEGLLFRVVGLAKLPQDDDLVRTRVDFFQQQTEKFDARSYDDITQNQMQFGGLECRILGTFYVNAAGELCLGSDIESFAMAARRTLRGGVWSAAAALCYLQDPPLSIAVASGEECPRVDIRELDCVLLAILHRW